MPPRTPLLRPDRFFAERDIHFPRLLVALTVLFAAGPFVVYGGGWVIVDRIDGTVMVDNPNRPPDWVCDDENAGESAFDQQNCDAPQQVEENIDAILWKAFTRMAGPIIVGFPLILGVITILLHAGVKLIGGSNGILTTGAIATWGMLPGLLPIPVALVALWLTLDPITVAPGDDPSVVLHPLRQQIEFLRPFTTVGSVTTAVWGGIIWRYGLLEKQQLSGSDATLVAGGVAILTAIAGFL